MNSDCGDGRQALKIWEAIGRLSGGGAETQAVMLSNGLVQRSIAVSVLYVIKKDRDPILPTTVKDHFITRGSKFAWYQVFKEVGRLMDLEKPDLVHVWLPEVITIPVALAAAQRGIPVLSSIRRSTFKGVRGINWIRDLLGLVPHFVSRRIASNFPLIHEPAIVRWLAGRKRAVVIPNGLDMTRYGQDLKDSDPTRLRLVFVGRFAHQKRLPFLLDALSQLPRGTVSLTVFGEGSLEAVSELKSFVQEHGLSEFVDFKGFVSNWRVYSGAFDFLVTPSISEGMPNVVLEAMAEGVPVIASDIPEMREVVVDGQNGYLFEADNREAMIDLIKSNLNVNLSELRAGARRTAEEYTGDVMVSRYIELYQEMIQAYG